MSGPVAPHTYGFPTAARAKLIADWATPATATGPAHRTGSGTWPSWVTSCGRQALPLAVGVGERRALHDLGGVGERHGVPARYGEQALDELTSSRGPGR